MTDKVLVTGGAGFLGSHISDALSDKGYEVTILDIKPSPYIRKDQQFIGADICNLEELTVCLKGMDYVYHLAAFANLNDAKTQPVDTVNINIMGTVNMLRAAQENKVKRFIFGSTVYVYSREGGFYRCSKQACENYIEEFYNTYELDYTILRFGSLYGPRTDIYNGVYRLLKNFIDNDCFDYDGHSTDIREYIHVYDAARLSVQILAPEYMNKNIILTGNDKMDISELFKIFEEILNKKVNVRYLGDEGITNDHYSVTPYAYTPKIGSKLVSNEYVDMGQGIIQLIEEIENK